jgi:hypothetical protein
VQRVFYDSSDASTVLVQLWFNDLTYAADGDIDLIIGFRRTGEQGLVSLAGNNIGNPFLFDSNPNSKVNLLEIANNNSINVNAFLFI